MKQNEALEQIYRLINHLDVGTPGFPAVAASARELRLSASLVHRWSELVCNGVTGPDGHAKWDDNDEAKAERAFDKAEKRVNAALDQIFDAETRKLVGVEIQRDPRGAPVKLYDLRDGSMESGSPRVTFW